MPGAPGAAPTDLALREDVPPKLARLIYLTLVIGVGTSATLMVAGLVLLLAEPTTAFTTATTQGASFTRAGLATGLRRGQAVAVLLIAFLVLIATPLFRVVISTVEFATAHDRPFTILTLTVLLLLALSVLLGAVS